MEVLKMKETNQEVQIDSTALVPPKRKRGRPRKIHHLYPGEKNLVPQRLDGKKKTRRKKLDSSLSSFSENVFVGQAVHGVLDGSFDAGYLLTVRVGDTETVLRGVVFEPGLSLPISKGNDIAPNVKMTRRDDNSCPSELPQSIRNTMIVSMPSIPVPSLMTPTPVMSAQGTSSVPAAQQNMPHVAVGSEQQGVVSLHLNGNPQKSGTHHSSKVNEDSASKPAEYVSQLQQHMSSPTKTAPNVQRPISRPGEPSHLQKSICSPAASVSHPQEPIPVPAEPASHKSQANMTPQSVSYPQQQNPPCVEPHQPVTNSSAPVGVQMDVKDNILHTQRGS